MAASNALRGDVWVDTFSVFSRKVTPGDDGGNLVCATGAVCFRAALKWSPLSALRGGDL